MRLTVEQIEIVHACGSRVLPIAGYQFHLLAQQRRIFHAGDEAVVVRRPSGFLETHGTLELLLTQHGEAMRAAAADRPAAADLRGETRVPPKGAAPRGGSGTRVPRQPDGVAAVVSASTFEPTHNAVREHRAAHEEVPPELVAEDHRCLSQEEVQVTQIDGGPGRRPAVPVADSIHPDHLVCLEDGRELKMLTRYLKTSFGLSPEQYRERWSLPPDYPMVAPDTAERRLVIAKQPRPGTKARETRKQGRARAET